jgi:hypothetical protein
MQIERLETLIGRRQLQLQHRRRNRSRKNDRDSDAGNKLGSGFKQLR